MQSRIGYCCINLSLPSKFRSTTLSWCKKNQAEKKLFEIYAHNINELCSVLKWNIENKIWQYRISSSLFPIADHQDFFQVWDSFKKSFDFSEIKNTLQAYILCGGRVSMHPSQFISLGSPNPNVCNNSIHNLNHHGEVMDLFGLPQSFFYPINIHLSNGKSHPKDLLNNFYSSIDKLSLSVLNRLVFENEDSGCWQYQNIRKYFSEFPCTFDFLHWNCNNNGEDIDLAVMECVYSWQGRGYKPLFHYSEGKESQNDKRHSDYIDKNKLLTLLNKYNNVFDVEVEAKKKDLSIL